ncbi:hypothetical protein KR032_011175 [Drosophila birchii]|nr:hypothetical protein KR032_011175 [Drosophila birchii]
MIYTTPTILTRPNSETLTESASEFSGVDDWSCDDGEESDSSLSVELLPRTHRLILDYKQFKAAQVIQRYVRGWLVRMNNRKFVLAAIVIQKWWRRFMAKGLLLILSERKLQQAVISHYNSCATLIQKVFRGWWCRKHVNDLTKLKSLQTSLAEHLLGSLGSYLHGVRAKGDVPGLYYEQVPRKCLELINQITATLDYRIFNAFSCYKMQRKMSDINELRREFRQSGQYTNVPFRGFDDCGRVSVLETNEDAHEHVNLIRAFVCMKHDIDIKSKLKRKTTFEDDRMPNKRSLAAFLKRIHLDMKKWHDADGTELLPQYLFKMPDMKAFLNVAKTYLRDKEPCNCLAHYTDM